MILFVSGFNRSGTTVLQEAVACATGGTPLTVADLIRHGSPGLAARLRGVLDSPEPVDRGVDRRVVTGSTPEEYGWFLLDRRPKGRRNARFPERATAALARVAEEIGEQSGLAVLKNPSDTGREALLLRCFPEARVIATRRSVTGIMDSSYRAMARSVRSPTYVLALTGNSPWVRTIMWTYRNEVTAPLVRLATRWNLRVRVAIFLRTIPDLPLDRVAFLDYDELVEDADSAARWVGHLMDAERLGKEFKTAHSIPGSPPPPATAWIDRELDRRWARAWRRAREEQLRQGILPEL